MTDTQTSTDILTHAERLIALGYSCLPTIPHGKAPLKFGTFRNGCRSASQDLAALAQAYANHADAGLAVRVGVQVGIWHIDIDSNRDPDTTRQILWDPQDYVDHVAQQLGTEFRGPILRTASGGARIYIRLDMNDLPSVEELEALAPLDLRSILPCIDPPARDGIGVVPPSAAVSKYGQLRNYEYLPGHAPEDIDPEAETKNEQWMLRWLRDILITHLSPSKPSKLSAPAPEKSPTRAPRKPRQRKTSPSSPAGVLLAKVQQGERSKKIYGLTGRWIAEGLGLEDAITANLQVNDRFFDPPLEAFKVARQTRNAYEHYAAGKYRLRRPDDDGERGTYWSFRTLGNPRLNVGYQDVIWPALISAGQGDHAPVEQWRKLLARTNGSVARKLSKAGYALYSARDVRDIIRTGKQAWEVRHRIQHHHVARPAVLSGKTGGRGNQKPQTGLEVATK